MSEMFVSNAFMQLVKRVFGIKLNAYGIGVTVQMTAAERAGLASDTVAAAVVEPVKKQWSNSARGQTH
jgi:hypothetical protein